MRILIVSHASDPDGWSSAAYADHFLTTIGHEVTIVGVDYGKAMPPAGDLLALGAEADIIFVCDFVLAHPIMEEWHSQNKLIWIDHHKSAIEESLKFEYHRSPGIRRIGTAACRLTYEYLTQEFSNFNHIATRSGAVDEGPTILKYLGKYDVWEKDHQWDTHTLPIHYACMAIAHELRIGSPKFKTAWEALFMLDETSPEIEAMMKVGSLIAGYQRELDAELTATVHGAKIEGYPDLLFFALNGGRGTGPFDSLDKSGFDGMMVYRYTGTEWKISLYGWDGSPDMSEIAKNFGGGGHRGASGWRLDSLHPTIQLYPLVEHPEPGETEAVPEGEIPEAPPLIPESAVVESPLVEPVG